MKKCFLTPALLTPTLLISICLSSCSKLDDYQVTKEEFKKIIALENVQFMQNEQIKYNQFNEITGQRIDKCSPTVYYYKRDFIGGEYMEKYIIKNVETEPYTYTRIQRFNPQGEWKTDEASEDDFLTPTIFGQQIVDIYNVCLIFSDFTFDDKNKCYSAWSIENQTGDKRNADFHFYKKQLTKLKSTINDNLDFVLSFSYLNDQPIPPLL